MCMSVQFTRIHFELNLSFKYCGDISDPSASPATCKISPEHTQSYHRGRGTSCCGSFVSYLLDNTIYPSLITRPRYRRLLSQFDPNIRNPDATATPPALSHNIPIIGFSATFSRHDGLALGSVFERIVYHRDFLEMIKEQWLVCIVLFAFLVP